MRMFMSFNCSDVPALKIAIAAFNPTSLLELLGADAYDASISDLANLYIIYNFVHEHFWSDTGSDIPMPVPCASWHEYRDHYSDITAQIFPESSPLAQPAASSALSSRSASCLVESHYHNKMSQMVITSPPDTIFALWDWIADIFFVQYCIVELRMPMTSTVSDLKLAVIPACLIQFNCGMTELQTLMTSTFKCDTVSDLKHTVYNFNPASLIEFLGAESYDSWLGPLAELSILFAFSFDHFCEPKHFRNRHGSDIPLAVPCHVWLSYHQEYSDLAAALLLFPRSWEFEQPSEKLEVTNAWFVTSTRRSSQTSARRKSSRRSLRHMQIKRSDNARSPPALEPTLHQRRATQNHETGPTDHAANRPPHALDGPVTRNSGENVNPCLASRHSGEEQRSRGGSECQDPQSRREISQKRDHAQTRDSLEPKWLPATEETALDMSRRWPDTTDSQPFATKEPTVPPVFWFPCANGGIKFQRTSLAVTHRDEHATPSATAHLEDPSVLDSGEMSIIAETKDVDASVLGSGEIFAAADAEDKAFSVLDSGEMATIAETEDEDASVLDTGKMVAVADAEDKDFSVLDPGEKFETPVTEEVQSWRMCICNNFDAIGDAPWTLSKFQDHEVLHITVNVLRTPPLVTAESTVPPVFRFVFVTEESTVPPVFRFNFATGEPAVPHVFDPSLIRTSFDNLCKASCPTRTLFCNLCNQTSHPMKNY